ncbi:alpha-amylase family glycosyl hydrolase [Butyrivibrio sp. FC2001]|uniref:alpha-amylase family glycosyl hydrolase n=1 Tax=Butyrivibrio sp. FC2001 TaxID=1280671 RepID=UPI0003F4FCBD|nr:alpha-amylase family glycosyl hydrolase [Butyrivibrio sp. FC2001]
MKRRFLAGILAGMAICCTVAGCGKKAAEPVDNKAEEAVEEKEEKKTEEAKTEESKIYGDPIDDVYRTTYEIFVYSFYDSDGDGIGDLQGVIDKLDYINDGDPNTNDDLGCNQIWLMPICPSTTYHKYDVTDYCNVDPEYGTLDDYKKLVEEAHKRGIRVINDTVMNHSSSQHTWFKEATEYLKSLPEGAEPNAEECPYIDYYHFSKEPQSGYEQVPGADWYYECQFWSEMPDLNLDSEAVQKEFADIAKFWIDLGCDGFRMDAVTQFTTDDITMSTEQLSKFVDAVKAINPDAYIVGEAWTASGGYAKYYASGIDSLFDFDFSGSEGIISKCAKGKADPVRYVQAQIDEDELYASYNENYINAPFYTNHDMARSAGYYTGKKAKDGVKVSGALNLLMSGNAFIYYGEELGMKGSGKDENKRAPMQWAAEGTEGMTKGPSGMDSLKMSYGSLEEQKDDPDSIYNYYKKAIHIRNGFPAIARGKCTILEGLSGDRNVVWIKDGTDKVPEGTKGAKVLIAFNNGDEPAEIDLSKDQGADGYRNLATTLVTGEEDITLEGDILTVPSFGIAILTDES